MLDDGYDYRLRKGTTMTDSAAGEELEKTTSSVLCSICFDAVGDDVDRSRAKLQCGHQFHLDCIGSAFNVKGAMQCPNCRKVESGRWLYASGSTRSFPEISMDDWALHEDQHALSYHDRFIPWCPVHSTFQALGSSPLAYHNLPRHHMLVEHRAASSMTRSYVANFGPIPPASSNTSETIENPNISYHHWNGVSNPHVFSVTADMPYHNGVPYILPANSAHPNSTDHAPVSPVTLRSTRGDFGIMTRSGSYMHPFPYGHGRSHERLQPSHTIHHFHQPTNPLAMPAAIIPPSMARFHGQRVRPLPPVPANSVSDRNGGLFIVSPRGPSVHSSYDTSANSVSDHSGGFFSVAPRNSVVQSSNEPENLLQSSFDSGAGSDSNRTRNFWNGH